MNKPETYADPRVDPRTLAPLSEAISAAAADPAAWTIFLELFASATRSNRVSLHRVILDASAKARYIATHDTTGEFGDEKKRELEQYYAPRNPMIIHGRSVLVPGRPGHRLEACSDETYLSSEFYNDFMRPNDTLQIFGGVLIQNGPASVLLSASGSHRREPFGDPELRLLGALMPHLQTAFLMQERLAMLQDRMKRFETAFHATPDAAILVDDDALVLEANESARRILLARQGLYVAPDRLRIQDRALDARLTAALKGIRVARRLAVFSPPGRALRIPGSAEGSGWLMQIFPVEKEMAGLALIFLTPWAAADAPAESDLGELFGLSPAQRRIALALFEGRAPHEIGEHLGITQNTMKTHVRRLFAKLGISRQTELMRLLSRLKSRR